MQGNKGRILFLKQYLEEHTDDERSLSTDDIMKLYAANGFRADRKTIRDDIDTLISSGEDIIIQPGNANGMKMNAYHIGSRLFELPELRMLVDAVSSSRFITIEKSENLIRKLARLTNEENRDRLTSRIYVSDRLKTGNTSVLVNIDLINEAIERKKKISFLYWDYTIRKEKVLRNDGEVYLVSPYALIWNDDRYYCAAYSEKYERIVKYRIDRMRSVEVLDEDAVPCQEFNTAEYSRKLFNMYDNGLTEQRLSLLCRGDLMKNVIDRFGEEIETEVVDNNTFRAEVLVVPSSTFFSWVMEFEGGILIESPEEIKKTFMGMLKKLLDMEKKAEVAAEKIQNSAPLFFIQSPFGHEITPAAIRDKVGEVDSVYVRVDQNKLYWVKGKETGAVDIW